MAPYVELDPRENDGRAFNVDAFQSFSVDLATGFRRGTAPPNVYRLNNGINNWDMGIHKNFNLYKEAKFTFRAEFFNIWNHTQFSNPNSGVAAGANFGLITSTQHAARIIQLGGMIKF